MTDLTYSEAVEMLERLKGKVVLGPWTYEEIRDYETDAVFLRWDRYCFTSKMSGAVITSYGDCWRIESVFSEELLYNDSFATAELAMQAVDAHLATLPNVVAAGIH